MEMPLIEEQDKYNWEQFELWCLRNGINLQVKDDWNLWWDCWKTAIDSQ